jgi:hypothetical protein
VHFTLLVTILQIASIRTSVPQQDAASISHISARGLLACILCLVCTWQSDSLVPPVPSLAGSTFHPRFRLRRSRKLQPQNPGAVPQSWPEKSCNLTLAHLLLLAFTRWPYSGTVAGPRPITFLRTQHRTWSVIKQFLPRRLGSAPFLISGPPFLSQVP